MERVLAAALKEAVKIEQECSYWRTRALRAEESEKEWMRLAIEGQAIHERAVLVLITEMPWRT